jgi:hypothetical protein
MKLEFSRQIFENIYIKFHENPSAGPELFHADGRTDGRTDRQAGRQAGMKKI